MDYQQAVAEAVQGISEQTFEQYANQQGIPVNFNPDLNRLTVNNVPVNLQRSGLSLKSGQLKGTDQVYESLLAPFQRPKQGLLETTAYKTPEYLKQYIQDAIAQQTAPYVYDINEDPTAQAAAEQLQRSVAEMASKRGFLYGSAQTSLVQAELDKLAPAFEESAYVRNQDQLNRQMNMVNVIMSWDQIQAQRTRDNNTLAKMKAEYIMQLDQRDLDTFKVMLNQRRFEMEMALEEQKLEMSKKDVEIENAWRKVHELGYVDNETSILLGIDPGTEAGWVKQMLAEAQYQQALADEKHKYDLEQLKVNRAIEMDLIKEKERIQLESKLRLMETEYGFRTKMAGIEARYRREIDQEKEKQRIEAQSYARREAEEKARQKAQDEKIKAKLDNDYKYNLNIFKSKFVIDGRLDFTKRWDAVNWLHRRYTYYQIENPTYNRIVAEYRLPEYNGGAKSKTKIAGTPYRRPLDSPKTRRR